MSDMANDQEKRVKQLKRNLEGWREVLLPMNSVMVWEQNWHPGAIVGTITTAFLLVWWLDPAVLTLVSMIGLVAVLVDYLVPTIASSFCRADSWTGAKERRLEEVCRNLAAAEACILGTWTGLQSWRNARPKLYYGSVISGLLFCSYIGGIINNMFLTYLLVLVASLIPGLRRKGLIQKYFGHAIASIQGMVSGSQASSESPTNDKAKKN